MSYKHIGNLTPAPGSRHKKKRVGRGAGSGHGGTSTRGHKGHQSRSNFSQSPGFEGGQMPLYRKLPHRGFNNYEFRTGIAVVNVGDLAALDAKITEVDAGVLSAQGLLRSGEKSVKILGDGEITRPLKVTAAKFTGSAKAKIEQAGGQAIVA